MSTTRLSSLRSRIRDLRRRRAAVRHGAGYASLAIAAIAILAAAFLIDWLFGLTRFQRVVLLAAAGAALIHAVRKYVLPWFAFHETDLDVAQLVERQRKIDSDLVAALQFEAPEATAWGSPQLEGAVIDGVADASRSWDLFDGFSTRPRTRRVLWLVGIALVVGAAILWRPDFGRAFANRMLLGSARYPTRTQIQSVKIGGQTVPLSQVSTAVVKLPYGQAVAMEVAAGGELPSRGKVLFTASSDGADAQVSLSPDTEITALAPSATATYTGELPKLVDSVTAEVRLGDAWTDPIFVQMVPLPVVDVRLTPVPPPYARDDGGKPDAAAGSRIVSVIEGSRVLLELSCDNKELKSAAITIGEETFPLEKIASDSGQPTTWRLTADDTPLHQVTKPLRYELTVVDTDGLTPQSPLAGAIRIKADNRPRITGNVVTRAVLPTATPRIEYRATDDYGIRQLSVLLETLRAGSDGSPQPVAISTRPIRTLAEGAWIGRDALPVHDAYALDLGSLHLKKGDQLRVTLQVTDYRGEAPGQLVQSEPIVLDVTDETGILAAISASDERSARQLDALIERQLDVGGAR